MRSRRPVRRVARPENPLDTIFFLGVGMMLDIGVIMADPLFVIAMALALEQRRGMDERRHHALVEPYL